MGYSFFTPAPVASSQAAAKSKILIKMGSIAQQQKKGGIKFAKDYSLNSQKEYAKYFLIDQAEFLVVSVIAATAIMTTSMATSYLESRIYEARETQAIGKTAVNKYKMLNTSSG